MIQLVGVSKVYQGQVIFDDVTLFVGRQDRFGIVGGNGAGKSTLFRLITNEEAPDQGTLSIEKGVRLGYLPQSDVGFAGERAVIEQVLTARQDLLDLEHELEQLRRQLETEKDEERLHQLTARQGKVHEAFEHGGGYELHSEAEKILFGFGFAESDFRRPLREFSGGWKMRAALAKVLLSRPDILLLDEPTNHLDLESLIWLEEFLAAYTGAILLISHDRVFLDKVVRKMIEVEGGHLTTYTGNYQYYQDEKEKRIRLWAAKYENQQKEIEGHERFIARNRVRKDRARQVQARIRMLEKMERIPPPPKQGRTLDFRFPQPTRTGKVVMELIHLQKKYGEKTVYRDLNFTIAQGDKIALVGPNGAGKSTLLKILAGALPYDDGECRIGHQVKVGYFAQYQMDQLEPDKTVLRTLLDQAGDATLGTVRAISGAFLFSGDDADKRVVVLSGGEKSRLVLARLLLNPPNFLLLDEPTNHLDIPARDILEQALKDFQGSICLITHDRHLINAIANKVVEIVAGQPIIYPGNYDDYLYKKNKADRLDVAALSAPPKAPEEKIAEPKNDRPAATASVSGPKSKEQKRVEAERRQQYYNAVKPLKANIATLEEEIEQYTQKLEELNKVLADENFYREGSNFQEVLQEHGKLSDKVERLTSKWEKFASQLEDMEAKFQEAEEYTE